MGIHDNDVVVLPETDIDTPDEPTGVIPTTSSSQTVTTEPSTTTMTTTSVQLEVAQGVVCGDGLVKLDELVTETDNGCRPAECVFGRNATGDCRWHDEWAGTLARWTASNPTASTTTRSSRRYALRSGTGE